jgi:hypothetical protein
MLLCFHIISSCLNEVALVHEDESWCTNDQIRATGPLGCDYFERIGIDVYRTLEQLVCSSFVSFWAVLVFLS